MIQAAVIDLDGTVLRNDKSVTEYTKNILNELVSTGISVIFASGRGHENIDSIMQSLGLKGKIRFYVGRNGFELYDTENKVLIEEKSLSLWTSHTAMKFAVDHKVFVSSSCNGKYYIYYPEDFANEMTSKRPVENFDYSSMYWTDDVEMNTMAMNVGDRYDIFLFAEDLQRVLKEEALVTVTDNGWLIVTAPEVNKYYEVKKAINALYLNNDEVFVIGDGMNDIMMMDHFKYSVAMGNADERVKQHAKYIANDNMNDGAAEMIHKLILNREEY